MFVHDHCNWQVSHVCARSVCWTGQQSLCMVTVSDGSPAFVALSCSAALVVAVM